MKGKILLKKMSFKNGFSWADNIPSDIRSKLEVIK